MNLSQLYAMLTGLLVLVVGATAWVLTTVSGLRSDYTASITALKAEMVSKADFNKLELKLDTLVSSVNLLTVNLATATARLDAANAALADIKAQQQRPTH